MGERTERGDTRRRRVKGGPSISRGAKSRRDIAIGRQPMLEHGCSIRMPSAQILTHGARATRKNRSSGLKDRAKTSLSIPFHPSNSSSKPREGKKTRGDEKSSTRLSSPDLGKVQIIFISMECGGEGARLECKYGEGEKSSFRLATPK